MKSVGIQKYVNVDGHEYMLLACHYAHLNDMVHEDNLIPLVRQVRTAIGNGVKERFTAQQISDYVMKER